MSARRWVILFLVANFFLWQKGNPNPGSRLAALAAMSQAGSFRIDPYVSGPLGWTNDWALGPDGHFYSNKAPGPVLIAYPVFRLLDLFLERGVHDPFICQRLQRKNLPIYNFVLSALFQILPFAFLTAAILRHLERQGLSPAALHVAAAAVFFGNTASLLMNTYFGHGMAAVFLMAVVLCLVHREMAWASFFFAWAILCDYMMLALLPFFIGLILFNAPNRWRAGRLILAGLFFPACLWMLYHAACFGRPWRLPMAYQSPEFIDWGQNAWGGIWHRAPQASVFYELLFGSSRGILFTQPWLLILIPFLTYLLWKRRIPEEWAQLFLGACVGLAVLLTVNAAFGAWPGGRTIGPRYVSAILPVFGLAAAWAWDSISTVGRRLIGAGVGISLLFSMLVFSTTLFAPPGTAVWEFLARQWLNAPLQAALRSSCLLIGFLWASRGVSSHER